MKLSTALMLVFGLLAGQSAYPDVPVQHSCWVIIATVIDRTTGKRVQQSELRDSELEFTDPARCKAILARIHPVEDSYFTTVLTCRKVERAYFRGKSPDNPSVVPGQQQLSSET